MTCEICLPTCVWAHAWEEWGCRCGCLRLHMQPATLRLPYTLLYSHSPFLALSFLFSSVVPFFLISLFLSLPRPPLHMTLSFSPSFCLLRRACFLNPSILPTIPTKVMMVGHSQKVTPEEGDGKRKVTTIYDTKTSQQSISMLFLYNNHDKVRQTFGPLPFWHPLRPLLMFADMNIFGILYFK